MDNLLFQVWDKNSKSVWLLCDRIGLKKKNLIESPEYPIGYLCNYIYLDDNIQIMNNFYLILLFPEIDFFLKEFCNTHSNYEGPPPHQ